MSMPHFNQYSFVTLGEKIFYSWYANRLESILNILRILFKAVIRIKRTNMLEKWFFSRQTFAMKELWMGNQINRKQELHTLQHNQLHRKRKEFKLVEVSMRKEEYQLEMRCELLSEQMFWKILQIFVFYKKWINAMRVVWLHYTTLALLIRFL